MSLVSLVLSELSNLRFNLRLFIDAMVSFLDRALKFTGACLVDEVDFSLSGEVLALIEACFCTWVGLLPVSTLLLKSRRAEPDNLGLAKVWSSNLVGLCSGLMVLD